jgi:hypothetical protein
MVYIIPVEEGFILFRKAINEKNSEQYSLWLKAINIVFDDTLQKAYINNNNKKFEELKEILFKFIDKNNASGIFTDVDLHNFVKMKLFEFQSADILIKMKFS